MIYLFYLLVLLLNSSPIFAHEISGIWYIEQAFPEWERIKTAKLSWGEAEWIEECLIIDYETSPGELIVGSLSGYPIINVIRETDTLFKVVLDQSKYHEPELYYYFHIIQGVQDKMWIEPINDDRWIPNGEKNIFYKISSPLPPPPGYITTHRTLDRLRLRDSADTSSTTITVLPHDTAVQEMETGLTATIDGITAPWVRVLSSTGYEGWCFSGYLEPVSIPLPSPPEPAAEKPATAEGSVLTETRRQDEAVAIAEIAATSKKQDGIPVPVRIAIGVGILFAVGILFWLKSKKSRSKKW